MRKKVCLALCLLVTTLLVPFRLAADSCTDSPQHVTKNPVAGELALAVRPGGLMTDLIERTDVVYSSGYETSLTLPQMTLSRQHRLASPQDAQVGQAFEKNGREDHRCTPASLDREPFQYAAIATPRPRLSWVVPELPVFAGTADFPVPQTVVAGGVVQTACRIRLYRIEPLQAAAPVKGTKQYEYPMPEVQKTLVWDSGRVESSRSTAVSYGGPDLEPDRIYGWEVKVWMDALSPQRLSDVESEWSDLKLFKTSSQLSEEAISIEPLVKTEQRPAEIRTLDDGTLFADFGKAAFGQLRLTLMGGTAPSRLVLHLGERIKDGRVDREPFGTCRYRRIEMTLLPGLHSYQPEILPDWRNTHGDAVLMPDYIGEVLPFRYLEIEGLPRIALLQPGSTEPVEMTREITRLYVHHPTGGPWEGTFRSSDEVLNQVWELCKYSMEATSFIGYHIDGDRERIPYECDALINQLGWYGTDRSYTLSRRSIDYLLEHPTWPTEWILQTVLMAWYDYLYTGDTRLLESRYELIRSHTLSDLRQPNGLVSTRVQPQGEDFLGSIRRSQPIRDIVDWPQGKGAFGLAGSSPGEADYFEFTDYNAVVNAYHYATLCAMSRMAQALGRDEEMARWTAGAAAFKEQFNKAFLDRKTGLYRDGIGSGHSALHSNLFPLAFGLVPERRVRGVASFLVGKGMACSIANAKFLLDALYEAGEAEAALALLNATHDRSWYNAILAGSTITFEAWDDKYKGNQDWNHAWGAAPADLLPHQLLGVQPMEPGWDRILIRPQVASLEHVSAGVPTVKGLVGVTVERREASYSLVLHLPSNTSARVELPLQKGLQGRVTLDGEPVPARREGGRLVLDRVGSGLRVIEIQ